MTICDPFKTKHNLLVLITGPPLLITFGLPKQIRFCWFICGGSEERMFQAKSLCISFVFVFGSTIRLQFIFNVDVLFLFNGRIMRAHSCRIHVGRFMVAYFLRHFRLIESVFRLDAYV